VEFVKLVKAGISCDEYRDIVGSLQVIVGFPKVCLFPIGKDKDAVAK
jgi:hypothetical protein